MVELTNNKIDAERATSGVASHQAGAIVTFLGTTREFTHGRQTVELAYECYEAMALKELERLESEACQRWSSIQYCTIIHRLGVVPLGEASVLVAVSTPHRADAFDAAQWIMDELKQRVPIWKEERWADGSREWVHPGTGEPRPEPSATAGDAVKSSAIESSGAESSAVESNAAGGEQ